MLLSEASYTPISALKVPPPIEMRQPQQFRQQHRELLDRAEDFADATLRKCKHILPTVARLCLLSTFIEDGIRMIYQFPEQRDYMDELWGCGNFGGTLFVLINMFGQLVASGFVLVRKNVREASFAFFGLILFQTIAYQIFTEWDYVLRNLSLCGGVLLLLAESITQGSRASLFAGLPQLENAKPQNYMQLTGRLLVVLMFITLLFMHMETGWLVLSTNIVCTVLIIFVAVGYKTKLAALILVVMLSLLNIYLNPFWLYPAHRPYRDYLKYDFFQTLSVIGGLMLLVALGPGGVSLDEHKKKW